MPPRYRIGRAFRWRPTQACELSDLIRIHDEAGAPMIALANGHESGWSVCWAPGSRLLLDLLLEAWRSSREPIAARAAAALEEVRRQFPARAQALLPDEPDDLSGPPGGTLLVATLDGATCRLDWIGPDLGLVIRGGAVVARTVPHTLQEHARAQGMREEDVAAVPPVVLRSISEYVTPGFDPTPDSLTCSLEAGDCVLLVNDDLLRAVPAADLAACASTHHDPQALAEELVRRAFEGSTIAYAAAAAVRCDGVS
jgi:serine/threonine protein phosphatase PrpC